MITTGAATTLITLADRARHGGAYGATWHPPRRAYLNIYAFPSATAPTGMRKRCQFQTKQPVQILMAFQEFKNYG